MVVDRDAAVLREGLGVAALRRDAVDVPDEVENDPAAVGRDVEGHPGALLGGEIDLAGLAAGQGGVPVGDALGVGGGGGEEEGGGEGGRGPGERAASDGRGGRCDPRQGCLTAR